MNICVCFALKFLVLLSLLSVCNDGMYIQDRQCELCQGHCKNGAPCNKLTGGCDHGCENHWTEYFCHGIYILLLIGDPVN